ncbi:3-deoxy-manno-octulosonate cytidylyltransferase [Candidatus Tisiphia endosymbiont of Sialis lutaria]|uniref:3-deoxy-manno-octulosonate cytidylyltransferase n=1 Tax=Candidatus Tisiphia endosymbiont of Sialis lutaria TaxID=2029164 RepID=UPI00312C75F2
MHSDVAIIIPSRLDSVRLPKKPLQLIGELSIIERVLRQVHLTKLKNIYVATDSEIIAKKVTDCGGQLIMTTPDCQTGTDRVYEAFQTIPNNHNINYILNVQGDMPFIEPESIIKVIESLKSSDHDIMTPVVKVGINAVNVNSNVKVITDHNYKALYFSRSLIPYGSEEFLYHVGMYGFRKEALIKFINLPVSTLELNEKLEQLRALQNNMSIGVCYVNNIPISVDTPEDLNKAIKFYQQFNQG